MSATRCSIRGCATMAPDTAAIALPADDLDDEVPVRRHHPGVDDDAAAAASSAVRHRAGAVRASSRSWPCWRRGSRRSIRTSWRCARSSCRRRPSICSAPTISAARCGRAWCGARSLSMIIGSAVVAINAVFGTLIGAAAGYFRRARQRADAHQRRADGVPRGAAGDRRHRGAGAVGERRDHRAGRSSIRRAPRASCGRR